MKKISVICATPSHSNPGMFSVDLAFHVLCRRHRLPAVVRHRCLEDPPDSEVSNVGLPFRYESFRGDLESIYDSDLIVFWGDFLHAWPYHFFDVAQRFVNTGGYAQQADALPLIYEHLMLSAAAPEVLEKTLIFGGTVLLNDVRHYGLEGYGPAAARLFAGARCIWMRDVHSAAQIARARQDFERSYLGVDCALLLRRDDIDALAPVSATSDAQDGSRLGVFFGRTKGDHTALVHFARELAGRLGMKPEWVHWFGMPAKHLDVVKTLCPELVVPERPAVWSGAFTALRRCRFVVTDTYHLSLLAWRLGIPAVCVGRASEHANRTINDKKKEIFYYTYGAKLFYVFAEWLADGAARRKIVDDLAGFLPNQAITEAIIRAIDVHAEHSERQFVDECRAVLGV